MAGSGLKHCKMNPINKHNNNDNIDNLTIVLKRVDLASLWKVMIMEVLGSVG